MSVVWHDWDFSALYLFIWEKQYQAVNSWKEHECKLLQRPECRHKCWRPPADTVILHLLPPSRLFCSQNRKHEEQQWVKKGQDVFWAHNAAVNRGTHPFSGQIFPDNVSWEKASCIWLWSIFRCKSLMQKLFNKLVVLSWVDYHLFEHTWAGGWGNTELPLKKKEKKKAQARLICCHGNMLNENPMVLIHQYAALNINLNEPDFVLASRTGLKAWLATPDYGHPYCSYP